jgi:hypothetical protein
MGTSPISIGSRQPDYRSSYTANFVGSIDEVAVYNYALSAAQIQNHYIAGTNPVVRLYAQKSGPNVMLLWSPGTLQAAVTVNGTYTNVPGAASPYIISPAAAQQFYRVKVR